MSGDTVVDISGLMWQRETQGKIMTYVTMVCIGVNLLTFGYTFCREIIMTLAKAIKWVKKKLAKNNGDQVIQIRADEKEYLPKRRRADSLVFEKVERD